MLQIEKNQLGTREPFDIITPSHFFPFKAFLKGSIVLKRPFQKEVPLKRPFWYNVFLAIEQMEKLSYI